MKTFLKDDWFKIAVVLMYIYTIFIFITIHNDNISRSDRRAAVLNLCLSNSSSANERADCFRQFPQ
jgi:hypothetical protein